MQVKVSTRHGHLSEDAQNLIREKTQKLLHLFDRLTMIEVTVDLKNGTHIVEIQAQAEHNHDMIAKVEGLGEVMPLVDQAVHKMEGQLRRYKEKIQSHRRAPSAGEFATPAEAEAESAEQE